MSNIKFDPELIQNIRIIYGDANLDNKTLQQLYNTWQTNPEIIRNTAQQKSNVTKQVIQESQNPKVVRPQSTEVINDTAQDDLSNISSFGAAFKEARKRGLKQFKWKKTKANPSGMFSTNLKESNKTSNQSKSKSTKEVQKQETQLLPFPKINHPSYHGLPSKQGELEQGNNFIRYKVYHTKYPGATKSFSWHPDILSEQEAIDIWRNRPNYSVYGKEGSNFNSNRGFSISEIFSYYQQGGVMNNQEELQKAFMAYLIEDAAAQGVKIESEEQLRAYAEQLGQEGLKAKYQEFIKKMQGGRMARLGAKLEYYNYLKKGGKTCCEQKGGNIPTTPVKKQNEVQKFKSNRKRLDPEKTPTLPGGKYPSYWTPDERIKWERKYGDKQEGAAAVEPLGKNR